MKQLYKIMLILIICVFVVSCVEVIPSNLERDQNSFIKQKHQFEIVGCDIQYNKQSLVLGSAIDDWVKVLGSYDRMVELANDIYVWDEIGLQLYSRWGKKQVKSMNFIINQRNQEYFSYETDIAIAKEMGGDNLVKLTKLRYDARPKQLFQRWFKLDGILMGENIDFNLINDKRLEYHMAHYDWQPGQEIKTFHKSYVDTRYAYHLDCPGSQDYGFVLEVLPEDKGKAMWFTIGN